MKPKFRSLIAAFAPLSRTSLIVCASLCAASSAHADQTWTGDALDGLWTSTGNWSGAAIPGAADIAIFDASSDTNTATTLGQTFSIKGLKIVNPVAAVSIAVGNTLTLDSSGIDMSTATQDLTLNSPINAAVSQSWNIPTGRTLTVSGVVSGTSFTKDGAGNALFLSTSANTITGTVQHNAGQITVRSGTALGPATNTLALANGSIFRIETTGGGSGSGSGVFVGSPITVAASASVTQTTNSAANGYGGLITGDANSVFNIGAIGSLTQVSFSLGANTQQFGSFLGRVEITDGGNIRFSSTSLVNNGGASAIWDTNTTGVITARNTGTINLGSLVGSGTLSGSSGATGTTTFAIGGRNESCTFNGSIIDATAGSRIGALTKVGSETLTLTSATGLTYGGATNLNAGTLKINGSKTGTGATTVKVGTTLTGTGSVAGTTTVALDGHLSPGDGLVASGIGNITNSSLTLAAGSFVDLEFGSGNDTVTVASGGTLSLNPGVKINAYAGTEAGAVSFGTNGTYPIINVTGATVSGFNSSTFVVNNPVPGKVYSFTQSATAISLVVSDNDPSNYWAVDGSGTWNLNSSWSKNQIPNAIGALAKIGPGVSGLGGLFSTDPIITLDGNQTVGELTLRDDFLGVITINSGTLPTKTLVMDNGAVPAGIVSVAGDHTINAPVSVDAEGLAVDVVGAFNLSVTGVVSGSSASLRKTGTGTLALSADNTYGGGTILSGGAVSINSATSMGAVSAAATFSGGSVKLATALTGITRSYLVTGANSAIIDTNGNDFGYAGVIAPSGGGTGGLTKNGTGTLALSAAQTYTGATTVTGGILEVSTTGSIGTATAAISMSGGGRLTVSGGAVAASAVNVGGHNISGNLTVSGGSLTATGNITSSDNDSTSIQLTGGTVTAGGLSLPRTGQGPATSAVTGLPAAAISTGIYVNGSTVSLGAITIGSSNSSASVRVDSGSVTSTGVVVIGANTGSSRWNYLNVNGGTFTSTNAVTGIQIGKNVGTAPNVYGNLSSLYLSGGVTTAEIITFGAAADTVANQSYLTLNGGALYVGSGGIVRPAAISGSNIFLVAGTLGAKANWSTVLNANLTGSMVIKAADASDVARDISIAGVVGGAGSLDKTGGGSLTLSGANTYTGPTTVTAGTLNVTGDGSLATGAVTVASAATLGGNGNIGGSVTIQSGGHHALAVAATSGAQVTRVITGALDLQAGNILDLTSVGTVAGGTYVLVTATGGITGTPTTVTLNGGVTGTVSKNGNNLELVVSGNDYSSWISGFTFAPGADLTSTGDPDGDGMTNQQEYAFGLIPNSGSSVNPITSQLGKTTGLFTYTRRKPSLTGLTYVYQYSTTLGSWTTFTPDSTATNSGDPVEQITVDVPNPLLANGALFVRVTAQ